MNIVTHCIMGWHLVHHDSDLWHVYRPCGQGVGIMTWLEAMDLVGD